MYRILIYFCYGLSFVSISQIYNLYLNTDCLRETYNAEKNYNTLLDEMVSSMMLQTVAKFDDEKIPHHIKNILTPECGKSRRDRAHLFMQYVLVNDDVLRSFENVFEATNSIDLDNYKCTTHKPGTSKSKKYQYYRTFELIISWYC